MLRRGNKKKQGRFASEILRLLSFNLYEGRLGEGMLGFGFFASVTGFFCHSGLVRGFFATVGVGGFLRQCWGGFLRQWKGFWLRQGGFFASVVVFCDGNRGLLHRRRSTAERGLVRGFFATVGVGGFLRQCWEGFLRQWKGFWLRQGFFLHQWWFSATVTGVYYVGAGRQRSGAGHFGGKPPRGGAWKGLDLNRKSLHQTCSGKHANAVSCTCFKFLLCEVTCACFSVNCVWDNAFNNLAPYQPHTLRVSSFLLSGIT